MTIFIFVLGFLAFFIAFGSVWAIGRWKDDPRKLGRVIVSIVVLFIVLSLTAAYLIFFADRLDRETEVAQERVNVLKEQGKAQRRLLLTIQRQNSRQERVLFRQNKELLKRIARLERILLREGIPVPSGGGSGGGSSGSNNSGGGSNNSGGGSNGDNGNGNGGNGPPPPPPPPPPDCTTVGPPLLPPVTVCTENQGSMLVMRVWVWTS